MDNIESLFDKAEGEIERMLNTKTVVGEPITVEGNTLIPLVSVGFGFGVGAGQGSEPQKGTGHGGGTGGGGGVKPVALIVVNADGVRLDPIKSGTASVLEKVAETLGKTVSTKESGTRDLWPVTDESITPERLSHAAAALLVVAIATAMTPPRALLRRSLVNS